MEIILTTRHSFWSTYKLILLYKHGKKPLSVRLLHQLVHLLLPSCSSDTFCKGGKHQLQNPVWDEVTQ